MNDSTCTNSRQRDQRGAGHSVAISSSTQQQPADAPLSGSSDCARGSPDCPGLAFAIFSPMVDAAHNRAGSMRGICHSRRPGSRPLSRWMLRRRLRLPLCRSNSLHTPRRMDRCVWLYRDCHWARLDLCSASFIEHVVRGTNNHRSRRIRCLIPEARHEMVQRQQARPASPIPRPRGA
jgi:hypothetical protein